MYMGIATFKCDTYPWKCSEGFLLLVATGSCDISPISQSKYMYLAIVVSNCCVKYYFLIKISALNTYIAEFLLHMAFLHIT